MWLLQLGGKEILLSLEQHLVHCSHLGSDLHQSNGTPSAGCPPGRQVPGELHDRSVACPLRENSSRFPHRASRPEEHTESYPAIRSERPPVLRALLRSVHKHHGRTAGDICTPLFRMTKCVYCVAVSLMTNHVHLIVVPGDEHAMARAIGECHMLHPTFTDLHVCFRVRRSVARR